MNFAKPRTIHVAAVFAVLLLLAKDTKLAQDSDAAEKIRRSEGFQKMLSLFGEPQIYNSERPNVETYRLFVSPTFSNPLSIRIEASGNDHLLVAKNLSGLGGYGWGTLKDEKRRRLSDNEWRDLVYLLDRASFWSLAPTEKTSEPNDKGEVTVCLDSTSWSLEGVRNGKYHVVDRYCPEWGSFRAVGMYMVKLSKLKVDERLLR